MDFNQLIYSKPAAICNKMICSTLDSVEYGAVVWWDIPDSEDRSMTFEDR